MKFNPPLRQAILLRRYKRFLADVVLDDREITVHCANTGSMTNCVVENSPCWLSESANPKRKYPYSLELVSSATGHLAGVNTLRANTIVAEALDHALIKELVSYDSYRREATFGANSRVDFLLTKGAITGEGESKGDQALARCFLEVKSVTYGLPDGLGIFPDARSERASRHLDELIAVKKAGDEAALLFCVQHEGIKRVAPAEVIDPLYAAKLREAEACGVTLLAYACALSPEHLSLTEQLKIEL